MPTGNVVWVLDVNEVVETISADSDERAEIAIVAILGTSVGEKSEGSFVSLGKCNISALMLGSNGIVRRRCDLVLDGLDESSKIGGVNGHCYWNRGGSNLWGRCL